jgi:hypothetical protein
MFIPCLRCGECCKREPGCLYGRGTPCEHLVLEDGVYSCGEVLAASEEDREDVMFDLGVGEGCCQPCLRKNA